MKELKQFIEDMKQEHPEFSPCLNHILRKIDDIESKKKIITDRETAIKLRETNEYEVTTDFVYICTPIAKRVYKIDHN